MKTRSFFLLFFINALLINIQAQKLNDHYYHLVGTTSDNSKILLDITVAGGRSEGICTINYNQTPYRISSFHVSGRCDEKLRTITIDETNNLDGSSFLLTQSNHRKFNAIWKPENAKDSIMCQFHEKYPEGSIHFKTYSDALSYTLFPMLKESPKASYRVVVVEADSGAGRNVLDSINMQISKLFFTRASKGEGFAKMIDFEATRYFQQYADQNTDIYNFNDESNTFCWDKHQMIRILHNQDGYLCIGVKHYAFTGSGKGMIVNKFVTISTRDGQKTSLDHFLKPGYDSLLNSLITSKIRDNYLNNKSDQLASVGFFTEKPLASENFYLTGNSFVFIFNPYEIANASVGVIEISIPFSELEDFLVN